MGTVVIILGLLLAEQALAKPSLLHSEGVLLQYGNLSPRVPLGPEGTVKLITSADGTTRIVETAPIGTDGRVVDTNEVYAAKEAHARARINDRINLANEAARSAAADRLDEQFVEIPGGILQGRNLVIGGSGTEVIEVDNVRGRGQDVYRTSLQQGNGQEIGRADTTGNEGSVGGQNDQSRSTLVQASGNGLLQVLVTDDGGIVSSVTPSIRPDGRARVGQDGQSRVGHEVQVRVGHNGQVRVENDGQARIGQNGQTPVENDGQSRVGHNGHVRVFQNEQVRIGQDGRLREISEVAGPKAVNTVSYLNERINLANQAVNSDSDVGITDEGYFVTIPPKNGEASIGVDGRVVDTPEVAVARALHAAVHVNERVRFVQEAAKANEAASDLNDPCPCGNPY